MNNAALWFLVAILVAPAASYFVYRVARGLGFLDPPVDRQHELRRTILVSIYCFLLFLPVGIYGFEKGWPRVWILFGILLSLTLVFFAAGGILAGLRLWKIRHPPAPGLESSQLEGEPSGVEEDVGGRT
ncbi:MAG TPA: hypothetical protein VK780_11090 [Thermoanaerobaculia bacterium]|jgi:hypothetical protein|nr:hypothetical protein [Thermoanaerobaculia bacterium]